MHRFPSLSRLAADNGTPGAGGRLAGRPARLAYSFGEVRSRFAAGDAGSRSRSLPCSSSSRSLRSPTTSRRTARCGPPPRSTAVRSSDPTARASPTGRGGHAARRWSPSAARRSRPGSGTTSVTARAAGHRVYAVDLPPFGYSERRGPYTLTHWLALLEGFEKRLRHHAARHRRALPRSGRCRRRGSRAAARRRGRRSPRRRRARLRRQPRLALRPPRLPVLHRRSTGWRRVPTGSSEASSATPGARTRRPLPTATLAEFERPFRVDGTDAALKQLASGGIPGLTLPQLGRLRVPRAVLWGADDNVDWSRERSRLRRRPPHSPRDDRRGRARLDARAAGGRGAADPLVHSRGRRARSTALPMRPAKPSSWRIPRHPAGSCSSNRMKPEAIGTAFVASVASPAVVSAPPAWNACWRSPVPNA